MQRCRVSEWRQSSWNGWIWTLLEIFNRKWIWKYLDHKASQKTDWAVCALVNVKGQLAASTSGKDPSMQARIQRIENDVQTSFFREVFFYSIKTCCNHHGCMALTWKRGCWTDLPAAPTPYQLQTSGTRALSWILIRIFIILKPFLHHWMNVWELMLPSLIKCVRKNKCFTFVYN